MRTGKVEPGFSVILRFRSSYWSILAVLSSASTITHRLSFRSLRLLKVSFQITRDFCRLSPSPMAARASGHDLPKRGFFHLCKKSDSHPGLLHARHGTSDDHNDPASVFRSSLLHLSLDRGIVFLLYQLRKFRSLLTVY